MKSWILSAKALVVTAAIVLAPACGNQAQLPQINGVKGPFFNVVDGKVVMTIKFLNLNLDGGAKIPVPETRESYAELAPNVEDGGMMFSLYADADDLAAINIGVGDGNTLPDGRPLPGIVGGRLENSLRVDTHIAKQDLSFYFHKTLFGVWLPFGFETAGISGYWNININQKNLGFLGIVGNEGERKAGAVVLLRLNNLKDAQLKKLLDLSKRNPHLVY